MRTITSFLLPARTSCTRSVRDRLAPPRRKRQLIAELERLSGKKVLLEEAA